MTCVATTRRHDLCEAGQVMLGMAEVKAVSVARDFDNEGYELEVTVGPDADRVPPRVLRIAADFGIGLAPSRCGARGNPRHFVVVFR